MALSKLQTGHFAGLYVGAEDVVLVDSMEEVDIVKDVTVNMSAEMAEDRTRQSRYPRRVVVSLDISLEFQISYQPGDAQYETIRDAYLAGTAVAFCALSEKRTVDGAEGPLGNFKIETFNRSEPRDGATVIDVTAQLDATTDPSWEEIAVS